jgi:hypothetical protein
MHRLAVLVLVPLVLGLFGCTALTGSQSAPDRNICNLLTVAEIDQYWGYPDTTPQSEQGQRGPTCGYFDEDFGTAIRLNLSPVAAIPCDQLKDSPNSDPLSGIGEWAYYSHDRQKIYTKKGNDCLEVEPGLGPGDVDVDPITSLTELARLAVGRL